MPQTKRFDYERITVGGTFDFRIFNTGNSDATVAVCPQLHIAELIIDLLRGHHSEKTLKKLKDMAIAVSRAKETLFDVFEIGVEEVENSFDEFNKDNAVGKINVLVEKMQELRDANKELKLQYSSLSATINRTLEQMKILDADEATNLEDLIDLLSSTAQEMGKLLEKMQEELDSALSTY